MRDREDIVREDVNCSAASERAAHQLARLAEAYNGLAPHGPAIMREGEAILSACADELQQLARRASKRSRDKA